MLMYCTVVNVATKTGGQTAPSAVFNHEIVWASLTDDSSVSFPAKQFVISGQLAGGCSLSIACRISSPISYATLLWLTMGAMFPQSLPASDTKPRLVVERVVETTHFETEIAVILRTHCLRCHGVEKQESGFRVDRRDDFLSGGDGGAPVVPHKPDESRLIQLVEGVDPDVVMPPDGNRLSDVHKKQLRKWVEEGADWPEKFKELPGKS